MVDKLNQQVTGSDTYLEEVKSALNKDDKRLGDVFWLSVLHKSNCGRGSASVSINR